MSQVTKKKTRPTSEALCASREEEILAVAVRLFAEHGYADGDTQLLADQLRVGKGTIYRYFPSKRELFLAAVDRVMRQMLDVVLAAMAPVEDPLEKLGVAIEAFLSFFAANPAFVELLIQERALFKDRKKPTFQEHREKNIDRWRPLYEALIADGRVRDIPVDRILRVVSDLLYGTIFTNYFAGQTKSAAAQAQDVLDILFHGILSDRERSIQATRPA
jgi:AcrR family transcriptional regulator